jgi:hypothetical protein
VAGSGLTVCRLPVEPTNEHLPVFVVSLAPSFLAINSDTITGHEHGAWSRKVRDAGYWVARRCLSPNAEANEFSNHEVPGVRRASADRNGVDGRAKSEAAAPRPRHVISSRPSILPVMFSIIAVLMLDIINSTTSPTMFLKFVGDCCVSGCWRWFRGTGRVVAVAAVVARVERDEVGPLRRFPVLVVDNPKLIVVGHVGDFWRRFLPRDGVGATRSTLQQFPRE